MFKTLLIFAVFCVYLSTEALGDNSIDLSWKMKSEWRVNLGGNNYYFENIIKSNWYQAQEFCKANGMELISLETPEENQMILAYLKFKGDTSLRWTSGSDYGLNNTYVWISTGTRITYSYFQLNQPDHAIIPPYEQERVIELKPNAQNEMKWNDRAASYLNYFICEDLPPCKLTLH